MFGRIGVAGRGAGVGQEGRLAVFPVCRHPGARVASKLMTTCLIFSQAAAEQREPTGNVASKEPGVKPAFDCLFSDCYVSINHARYNLIKTGRDKEIRVVNDFAENC